MGSDQLDRIDPGVVDAISSLGNSQRLRILLALGDVVREHHEPRHTMTFTELYQAVDIDSSSQFSYHLDQLVGQFVTETSDGYRLTDSGSRIVRVIHSGVYESTTELEDREISGACLFCNETALLATLDADLFRIRCTSCDAILITVSAPRSQTRDRTLPEIYESFGYRIWSMYVQLRGGVCPECFGPVDMEVDQYEHGGTVRHIHNNTCRECQHLVSMPVEVPVAFHPGVLYLFWEHGISILDIPLWELNEYTTSDVFVTEIVSEEPFEADFTITLEDEVLSLRMDDTATVTLESWTRD